MAKIVRIHKDDNVVVVLEALSPGTTVRDDSGEIAAVTAVPLYHKIAVKDIKKGTPVIKYGAPIGIATEDIPRGAHVHVHNLDSAGTMLSDTAGGTR